MGEEEFSRLSEEARRELLKLSTSLVSRPMVASVTVKTTPKRAPSVRRAPAKKDPSITDYIRKEYPEDQVLLSLADILDKNKGMWQAMMQLFKLNLEAGDGLRGWDVQRRMAVREPLTTTVALELIDMEGTKRARS
jgi:hypothetical protein